MLAIRYRKVNACGSWTIFFSLAILTSTSGWSAEAIANLTPARETAVPLGLDSPIAIPDDNPSTPEKIALGRKLFFDPILSRNSSISCSSCHVPDHGFGGDVSLPTGIEKRKGRRNAPSLLNRAYSESLFWDGRVATLEAQALQPIQNPTEMGASLEEVLQRLRSNPDYERAFKVAFADGISATNMARALASYERTLLTGNSAVDRFHDGNVTALSESARQGLWLFESRSLCWKCHSGRNFTDEKFHNTGVSSGKIPADRGRFEVTGKEEDQGRFKTPTLRNVAKTGPYMHDGGLATLREVVEFYSRGGTPNPNLDPFVKPLNFSDNDIQNLVDFLEALTGETPGGHESQH